MSQKWREVSERKRSILRPVAATIELMEQRRLLSAGMLDQSFGEGGVAAVLPPAGDELTSGGMAVQNDGKVLLSVEIQNSTTPHAAISNEVYRFLSDGSLDSSFGTGGVVALPAADVVSKILLQPNGKIVLVGSIVGRFNTDGSLDKTFAAGAGVEALTGFTYFVDAALQPGGGIVVDYSMAGVGVSSLVRFNPDGSQDKAFGVGGVAALPAGSSQFPNSNVGGLTTDAQGRIILSVSDQLPADQAGDLSFDYGVVRLLPNGDPDSSFGEGGLALDAASNDTDEPLDIDADLPGEVAVAPDGTIYQITSRYVDEPTNPTDIYAYSPDGLSFGVSDSAIYFASSGIIPDAPGIAVQSDGDVLVTGENAVVANFASVFRLLPFSGVNGSTFTFDSDFTNTTNATPGESDIPTVQRGIAYVGPISVMGDGRIIVSVGSFNEDGFQNSAEISRLQGDPTFAASGTISNAPSGSESSLVGETFVPGQDVYADLNNNGKLDPGEPETSTGADGSYTLEGLPVGPVVIRQVLGAGERQIFPDANRGEHVTISSTPVTGADFAVTTNVYVYGTVFNDANSNGKLDASETGLKGWTVYADLNNDGKFESNEPSTLTDASGGFSFAGLSAGSYIFRVIPPSGWHQTYPTNNLGQHVTLASGGVLQTVLFGFAQTAVASASISGSVFDDLNNNGKMNSGEAGLEGWTVYLDLSNSGTLAGNDPKTMTDANGDFSFLGLAAGNYIVRVIRPAGWTQTTPSNGFGWHVALGANSAATGVLFGEHE